MKDTPSPTPKPMPIFELVERPALFLSSGRGVDNASAEEVGVCTNRLYLYKVNHRIRRSSANCRWTMATCCLRVLVTTILGTDCTTSTPTNTVRLRWGRYPASEK